MTDRYDEIVEYISSIPRFTTKTELKNTERLLEMLGEPHKCSKAIHIAGTNGKGSVAKMMSLILGKQGIKTGLFVSPHLVRLNERISINGTDISDAIWCISLIR
jgi:dihydrofolate synthase/folylpolyglutamate synthase